LLRDSWQLLGEGLADCLVDCFHYCCGDRLVNPSAITSAPEAAARSVLAVGLAPAPGGGCAASVGDDRRQSMAHSG
jgi:hypothetical protein